MAIRGERDGLVQTANLEVGSILEHMIRDLRDLRDFK